MAKAPKHKWLSLVAKALEILPCAPFLQTLGFRWLHQHYSQSPLQINVGGFQLWPSIN